MKSLLIMAAYLGCLAFLFLFIVKYKSELFGLKFDRLGGLFGDENDIAIFNCIGFCISFYYLFFNSNIYIKIVSFFLSCLFLFVAISSGSKIVILITASILVFSIFAINKKEKWWLSIIELVALIVVFVLILNLPFAKEIRTRFLSMINIFTTEKIRGADSTDLSTINRAEMFVAGLQMFLRKPLLGWGANGFATFGGLNGGWTHNHLSELLCDTGIIGFVTYHLPFFCSYIHYLKKPKKENILSFELLLMFTIASISIVLASEKMFAFLAGVIFSSLIDSKPVVDFKMSEILVKVFKKRNTHYENS